MQVDRCRRKGEVDTAAIQILALCILAAVVAVIVGAESGISWRRPAQAQPVAR
ncbi:hypothetical protein C5142_03505 [Rhodococcus sp. BGS-1C]